jgi:LuxR family quorum sensing-dependent transcriptional regulator
MLGEFSHIISGCTTVGEVRMAFRRAIEREGYTSSACRAHMPSQRPGQWHNFFRDWPEGWMKLSDNLNFAARSVILDEAQRRIFPFTWCDVRTSRVFSAAEEEVWKAAAEWGWANGFVVPVHGPGGYLACIGMASPERDLDLGPNTRARLHMLALIAHERCLALTGLVRTENPRTMLSARELECMRWVGAGKTDWEIGMILSISASTVKFHIDRAREKLGTRTRAQAVARLGSSGW